MTTDSEMTLRDALVGTNAPDNLKARLSVVRVVYLSFDGAQHRGQLVVASELADEVVNIFNVLLEHSFPIEKVIPIVSYQWDDHASIRDNNTSAFNYRIISGTNRLSNHSYGRAIDINPKLNPYFDKEGNSRPLGLTYDPKVFGTIIDNDIVVKTFLDYGWEWGGHWQTERGYVDYQHFQKAGK